MEKLRKYFKQSGQGIVEYALLLAFIVGIAGYIYTSGLADSVKQAYASVSSAIAMFDGEKSEPEPESESEKNKKADENNAKTIAQALRDSMIGANKFVTFPNGEDGWLAVTVSRNADGTYSVNGGASHTKQYQKTMIGTNTYDRYDGNEAYMRLWNDIITPSGSGISASNITINDSDTSWYGVVVYSDGTTKYHYASSKNSNDTINLNFSKW